MSRPTRRTKAMDAPVPAPTGGTPIVVWLIYGLGILAATVFVLAGLFVLGAYIASDGAPFSIGISTLAIVVWGAFIAFALGTLLIRRGGGHRW